MGDGFSEMARKWLHVAMGGFALALAYLTWWQAFILAAVAFLHNLLLLPRYLGRKVYRSEPGRGGPDYGILFYPVSIAILIVVFRGRPEIVAVSWGLLAFGDGFATIVGKSLGGPRLPWNPVKSWSGYMAFAAFGFLPAALLYRHTAGGPLETPVLVMILATTLLAATLETLPLGIDDNLLVPFASAGFLFCLTLVDREVWERNAPWIVSNVPWAIGVNGALAAAAYAGRSVSLSGVAGGMLMGMVIYAFGGWRTFAVLLGFFLLGSVTTRIGFGKKAALGIAQERGGRRGAKNAVANCGMGAMLAFVAATSQYESLALLGLVAAFATAACDTTSSEIGQAYGSRAYLVTTFRRVPAGTDGAVSLQGTLAGIGGASVIALLALALGLVTPAAAALVVLAAFLGSTLESYMGALWERSGQIDNEMVNFSNTLAGSLFAIGVAALFPSTPFLSRA